ncbi:MAG: hypothetical protein J1F41_04430 [Lachnospiraceae bacterium]|nr:hypothetical protein [Lachnospiraceae bacterium]
MSHNKYFPLLIITIESFFTTWALMKAGRMEPGNLLTGAFFLLSFFLYRRIDSRLQTKSFIHTALVKRTALIIGILFSLLYMAVDYSHYIELLTNTFFRLTILAAVFIGFTVLFYHLLLLLFSYTGDKELLTKLVNAPLDAASPLSDSRFPRLAKAFQMLHHLFDTHTASCGFGLCMLCWLPYFLYQYPGIMTPDSINQFEQVLGLLPYSNHHPLVHTMLIKLFYHIGLLFTSDMVIAISFYTFFQMCFMAFCVSYLLKTLKQSGVRTGICFFITLYYALVPYHAVFVVTIWKDILFAGFVLLFGCSMLSMSKRLKATTLALFIFSGIMLCLMRSNGWYGFLVSIPFLLYHYRRKARVFFPALAAVLITAAIIKYPVMNALHVIQPDLIESLSIPSQQVAAVICNDRELTEEQLDLIEHVVDLTYIKELYNPTFADNIKELVRAGDQSFLAAHKKEFLSLYLSLGMTYPGDYLKAYIDQTYGYWYPDSFYPVADVEGISATSLGVSHTPLIGGPLVVKTKEIAIKLGSMLPIYSLLWSMGVVFWFFIFCIGNIIIRSEKEKLIYFIPGFAMYLTVLIATPVATEFRYVYFMIFSLPFYAVVSCLNLDSNESHSSSCSS